LQPSSSHPCSLSALLTLREALGAAAEQRRSLLEASAQAEQLWAGASHDGFGAADFAQPADAGLHPELCLRAALLLLSVYLAGIALLSPA
jgi:hypothetical protein